MIRTQQEPDGTWRPVLDGDARDFAALSSGPHGLEPALRHGRWLILTAAIWSVPDLQADRILVAFARQAPSSLRFGVRVFDAFEEFGAWCPSVTGDGRTPIWVVLLDGLYVGRHTGHASIDDLDRLIRLSE